MPENIFIQIILFGLAFLAVGWNICVLVFAYRRRPLKLKILAMADERDRMLIGIVRASVRSGFYMVLTIFIGTLVITVCGLIRNHYMLPWVYVAAPSWLPLVIVLTYIGFYTLIFVPTYFYYSLLCALLRLNATQEAREEIRNGNGAGGA